MGATKVGYPNTQPEMVRQRPVSDKGRRDVLFCLRRQVEIVAYFTRMRITGFQCWNRL